MTQAFETLDGSGQFPQAALDRLFNEARSHNKWSDESVTQAQIGQIYDLLKWGPTSANCSPGRFVFLQSDEAKARLAKYVSNSNRSKVLTASVCVIIAYDRAFADQFPTLFPHNPGVSSWFADPKVAEETAFRNGTLQAAYLMMAARALGLDCGPMSGFDTVGVDHEFLSGKTWTTNLICSLGRGDPEGLFDRLPRLGFDEACAVL